MEEYHTSPGTQVLDCLSPLKLLPSCIRAVTLPCTPHTACKVHFPRLWITAVGRSPTENSQFHSRKKIPFNLRHSSQTIFISISHIVKKYCAKLVMISNTNYVHSIFSGQSDLMLQCIWISEVFWENNINSIVHVPLNNLGTQFITMEMIWIIKILRYWPDFSENCFLYSPSRSMAGECEWCAGGRKLGGKRACHPDFC